MYSRFQADNFFVTTISADCTLTPWVDWTIPVQSVPDIPAGKLFYVIFKIDDKENRFSLPVFLDNNSQMCYKWYNVTQIHELEKYDSVWLNDLAENFNYLFKNIDDIWTIVKKWWLDILVYGWIIVNWGTTLQVSDTTITLDDNVTSHIIFDFSDNTIKAVSELEDFWQYYFADVTTLGWVVTAIELKKSFNVWEFFSSDTFDRDADWSVILKDSSVSKPKIDFTGITADDIEEWATHLLMTPTERNELSDVNDKKHTHSNKAVLDSITADDKAKLNNTSWTNTWDETANTIKSKLGAASASQDWYLSKEDFSTFNSKQNAIADLDTIRSWAAAWATALQPWDMSAYEQVANKKTSLVNPDNNSYPTTKAVSDAIEDAWGWDMLKSRYDPNNVGWDAFAMENMENWTTKKFVLKSSTAPVNPSEWDLWFDTVNDKLMSYNGATWDYCCWDISYDDFNFVTWSWASVTLSLSTIITPTTNFTVNAPATIEDWQMYLLMVSNWATAYTMTLGTWISNPNSVDLTLTANKVNQFCFLAANSTLILQDPWLNSKAIVKSATAPLNPTQWDLWYDTTNNKLKTYDWTNWNEAWTTPSIANSSVAWILKIASDTVQTEAAQSVSSTQNRTYWVQLNSSNQAVVNVPRENTTYQSSDFDIKDLTDSTWQRVTRSGSAPVNPVEWQLWYDTTNDVLKSYNGTTWDSAMSSPVATSSTTWTIKLASDTVQSEAAQAVGSTANRTYWVQVNGSWQAVINVPRENTITTRIFTLSSTSDTTNAQAAIDWIEAGNNAIISYNSINYMFTKTKSWLANTYFYYFNWYITLSNNSVSVENISIVCSLQNSEKVVDTITATSDTSTGWTDYSWETKTISGWTVEIWLRTIVEPTSNFTLNKPATLKDWEEYVLRCVNTTSYTITLWTWITNPRNVSLVLSQNATDQFVFLAINWTLELQPLVATWS